ncbi:MAG: PEPxxWA-CTERM sorting domain-containing protein [Sphingomonadaceae bacterium]|uniref:Npun_F0296 family exosortase-dependent surface protein n=1 Tax=Thermaurantiacus sp. TaxID=2820283 RepID=UPI00298F30AA|nr:PEPxxWA-CTERM sorting domain-containing protein [Thermaurantiacus sp.]MCS6986375.1 PEPxxWA-CTERM sorting domain-containing protein [Sphingomonadaceae bacterium]MDW8414363.1 PEPxxWA-CTERM sorting domain-containing protein [Thermaurantiacus sp.]
MRPILVSSALLLAAPASAAVVVTYEAPGVQHSTATFDFMGVETFETRALGPGQTFTTDFGGSQITGTYRNVQVIPADLWGGAGGVGRYPVNFGTQKYELELTTSRPEGVNYFGFWLSALDSRNLLEFWNGPNRFFTFTPADVLANVTPAHFCNPNPPLGRACHEPFVFVNFYLTGADRLTRVVFTNTGPGTGFESDNHTVGYFTRMGGNPVPEPTTWAMLVAGFGLLGLALRRRQVRLVSA